MKLKKLYLSKKKKLVKSNNYVIVTRLNNKAKNAIAHKITEPLFQGGSFKKILITHPSKNNLLETLTNNKRYLVCLFCDNKWYLHDYIKTSNLLKQNHVILALLYKLKNKIA